MKLRRISSAKRKSFGLFTGSPGIIGKLANSKNKFSGIGAPKETAKDLRSLEINAA